MIISQGTVGMAAASVKKVTYRQQHQSLRTNVSTGEKLYGENEFVSTYERSLGGNSCDNYNDQDKVKPNQTDNLTSVKSKEQAGTSDLVRQLRGFLLEFRNRLSLLVRRRFFGDENFSVNNGTLDISSGTGGVSVWNVVNYDSYTYTEEESMAFSTVGKVLTADGRSIDFDMSIQMSRKYVEETECLTQGVEVIMTDPLVISLDCNPVSVSDMKWQFDIDGDGKKDNISLLSKGCGFLAFDRNNDGIINDGTELFGAKTGNGFAELLQFDEDGNGWIDEQDSIYSRLKVWIKDDAGSDKLLSLKEAQVGAIYLANQRTEFSLKSEDDNEHNAQIRRSGVYLTEGGSARTIQQLDMVKALVG